ncbi:MAG: DUF2213 domain-containing protein [Hydrogenophaga sp.]|uniref:DUF2213 domain-containing protein n=1 Tax=Hydrogenophaga sp. TaxID=1904254 RepID=UPI0027346D72|nr:DUF2213 domain-containing protein [Hydrogenophaga sp.]MDP3351823.1 DUF2213 domain-containing protein [Hydrogenophaga sp.]
MTRKTFDRAKTHDRNLFYLADQIGEKRSTTPEGFLICHDVPIARTGTQMYGADEVPVEAGPDGLIRIDRLPDQVFRPETLASFEGKPVTVEHPNDFVTPENWQRLAVGFVQNVRRGEGIQDDLIVADLVITDEAAIRYVNETLPEVSAGYTAEYEQTQPGRGVQRDIVGNHVALVERGRAGPRCSIQDHEGKPDDMKTKDSKPAKGKPHGLISRLKAFLDSEAEKEEMKDADDPDDKEGEKEAKEKEEAKAKDQMGGGSVEERLERIEAVLTKLLPMEEREHGTQLDSDPDEEKKTGDDGDLTDPETAKSQPEAVGTVLSGDSLRDIVARAEILAPGTGSIRTSDSKGAKGTEVDAYMRGALEKAMATDAGKAHVAPFLGSRELKKLTGDALSAVFTGAAELARAKNNGRVVNATSLQKTKDFGQAPTPSAINAAAKDFWAKRGAPH